MGEINETFSRDGHVACVGKSKSKMIRCHQCDRLTLRVCVFLLLIILGCCSDTCKNKKNQSDCPDGEQLGPGGWCLGTRYREQLPPEVCNIARRPFSDLFQATATRVPLDEPIIFTNATTAWPAIQRWTRDRLLQDPLRGQVEMNAGLSEHIREEQEGGSKDKIVQVTVADHIRQIRQKPDHYIFGQLPREEDIIAFMNANLPKEAKNSFNAMDIFFYNDIKVPKRLSGKLWRKTTLALGGSRSGMLFHSHNVAWCALVYGRKRWLFYDDETFQEPPWANNYDMLVNQYVHDKHFRDWWGRRGWECVQEPGELMYIPAYFEHAVMNIGETIGIVGERCSDIIEKDPAYAKCKKKPKNQGNRSPRQKLKLE